MKFGGAALSVSLVLASAGIAGAADLYWNSATGGSWDTPGNWNVGSQGGPVSGSAPQPADNVFIGLAGSYVVTQGGLRSVNQATISATGATLRIQGSNALGAAGLTVANGMSSAGKIELTDIDSTWGSALAVTNGTLTITGTLDVLVGANGARTIAAQFNNSGTMTFARDTTINRAGSDHVNSGTISVTGGTTTIFGGGATPTFVNSGTINVAASRMLLIREQDISLNPGTTWSGTGFFATLNATLILGVNVAVQNSGMGYQIQNTTVNGPGTLRNEASSLRLALRSTTQINAPVQNANGAVLRLEGSNAFGGCFCTIDNGFTNAGTIEVTDIDQNWSASLTVTNGTVTNTGSIDVQIGANGGRTLAIQFNNSGSMTFGKDTSMTRSGSDHVNSGTISVTGGTTTIFGNGTTPTFVNSGTVNVAASQMFLIREQEISLNPGTTWSGTGFFATQNATLNLGVTVTVQNGGMGYQIQNTTVNGPGILRNEASSLRLALRSTTQINAPIQNAAGAVLRLEGSNAFGGCFCTIDNGFTNAGTIEVTDIDQNWSASLTVTNGTVTNTGSIDVQLGANGVRALNMQFDNQGSMTFGKDTNVNRPSSDDVSSGAIIANGNVTVFGGGTTPTFTNTGSFNIAAGKFFMIRDQDVALNSGSSYSGTGQLWLQLGTVTLGTNLTVPAGGATFQFSNTTVNGPGILRNEAGSLGLSLKSSTQVNATFQNATGAVLRLEGADGFGTNNCVIDNGFTNDGTIEMTDVNSNWGCTLTITNGALTNAGTLAILLGQNGARILGAQLANSGTVTIARDATITRSGANHVNSGNFSVTAGTTNIPGIGTTPSVTNSGAMSVATGASLRLTSGGITYTQTGGSLTTNGTIELSGSSFLVSAGELRGSGTIISNVPVSNTGATVSPGNSAGLLTMTADYVAGASTGFRAELGGTAPTAFDRCAISGPAALDGTIQVDVINGFVPAYADSFVVMTFPSRVGAFANRILAPLGGGLALRTRHNPANVTVFVIRPGDLNCNGVVNTLDVPAFVLALTNPTAFAAAFPGCEMMNGDFNADELVNGLDIQPFVQKLLIGP